MCASTTIERLDGVTTRHWISGATGGLVGGIAMGAVLQFVGVMSIIGVLVGRPTVLGGWVVHLFVSVFFGLVFAVVASRPFVNDMWETLGGTVGLGLVYGALLEVVTGGVILPLVVNVRGGELPVPLFPIPGVVGALTLAVGLGVGHLLYGAVLGAIYGTLDASAPTLE